MDKFEKTKLNIVSKIPEVKREKLERELLPKDRDLRIKLEEELTDDGKFLEIIDEMIRHLQRFGLRQEGVDKARGLASLYALVKQLKRTERSKLSLEFIRLAEDIRKNSPRAVYRKTAEARRKVA